VSVPDGLAKALRRHMRGELHKSLQTRLDSVGTPSAASRPTPREPGQTRIVEDNENETLDADLASQRLVDRGDNPECPECSNMLTLQEGCIKCQSCGYSEC